MVLHHRVAKLTYGGLNLEFYRPEKSGNFTESYGTSVIVLDS